MSRRIGAKMGWIECSQKDIEDLAGEVVVAPVGDDKMAGGFQDTFELRQGLPGFSDMMKVLISAKTCNMRPRIRTGRRQAN